MPCWAVSLFGRRVTAVVDPVLGVISDCAPCEVFYVVVEFVVVEVSDFVT
jgi:hypothetical protein